MKNKFFILFLASIMVVPVLTSVFAISSEELLVRLEGIKADVTSMKNEYNSILEQYSDVIDSLSAENKANALNLADNLMAEDIKDKLNAIKDEIAGLSVVGVSEVLNAIEDLEDDVKGLIEDNIDVLDQVKSGYKNMTIEEVKEILEKIDEISEELGYNPNTTSTYNELINIMDDAHTMGLLINEKIKTILSSNVDTFKEVMTFDIMEEVLEHLKAKDREAVIDTLKEALEGATNKETVKADLSDLKQDLKALKNKLLEANDLPETILIAFSDSEKENVSDKVKDIEDDYIDFAKEILNNHMPNYIHATFEIAYDLEVDTMIEHANKAVDYIVEYKETIKDIYYTRNYEGIISNLILPEEIEDIAKKIGIFAALNFIDVSQYNSDFVENNFENEIDSIADYTVDEVMDYLDEIDVKMQKEVTDEVKASPAVTAQSNIRTINSKRFTTLDNIKKLKTRVQDEILSKTTKLSKVRKGVDKAEPYVLNIFYTNILNTIERIMSLEKEKLDKKYEYNSAYDYILTNEFLSETTVEEEIGIPDKYKEYVTYENMKNSKIKTGSVMTIEFSNTVYGEYMYAVLGDVYADGKINSQDYMKIKNHIMEKDILTGIELIAADTYRNDNINSQDYMKIKNYIMNNLKISL